MGVFDFLRKLFGQSGTPPPRPGSRAPAPQASWPPEIPPGGTTWAPPPTPQSSSPSPLPPGPSSPWTAPASARPPQRPRETTLDLDASAFQPLSTDQVRAQAAGVRFSGFFEFG